MKGKKKRNLTRAELFSTSKYLITPIVRLTPHQIQDLEYSALAMRETIEKVVRNMPDSKDREDLISCLSYQAGIRALNRKKGWIDDG